MNATSFTIGGVLIFLGIRSLWKSYKLNIKGIFTVGTIKEVVPTSRGFVFTVQFKTVKNKRIELKTGGEVTFFNSAFYTVGNLVPVLYNREKPSDAVIYTWNHLWGRPFFVFAMGLVFLYFGIRV